MRLLNFLFDLFNSFQSIYAQSLNNKDSLDLDSDNIEYLKEFMCKIHISNVGYSTSLIFIEIR